MIVNEIIIDNEYLSNLADNFMNRLFLKSEEYMKLTNDKRTFKNGFDMQSYVAGAYQTFSFFICLLRKENDWKFAQTLFSNAINEYYHINRELMKQGNKIN